MKTIIKFEKHDTLFNSIESMAWGKLSIFNIEKKINFDLIIFNSSIKNNNEQAGFLDKKHCFLLKRQCKKWKKDNKIFIKLLINFINKNIDYYNLIYFVDCLIKINNFKENKSDFFNYTLTMNYYKYDNKISEKEIIKIFNYFNKNVCFEFGKIVIKNKKQTINKIYNLY